MLSELKINEMKQNHNHVMTMQSVHVVCYIFQQINVSSYYNLEINQTIGW